MAQMAALKAEGPSARRLAGGDPGNGYETELTSGAEKAYRSKFGPEEGDDYDLRGAHAAGLTDHARIQYVKEDGRTFPVFPDHLPDTYKKPNHETFSVESQYAPYAPERAGSWDGDRYVPSPTAPREQAAPIPPASSRNPNAGPYQDPDGRDTGDEDWSTWDDDNIQARREEPSLRLRRRA